jgi:hypothetical protein
VIKKSAMRMGPNPISIIMITLKPDATMPARTPR